MSRSPSARVAGSTRTVGIIGWPVSHSLSPAIHNAAFAALGLDWVYVPLPVHPLQLLAALTGLSALGFAGANVTMPHKAAVADLIEESVRRRPAAPRREHDRRATANGSAGRTPTRPGSSGSSGWTRGSTRRDGPR